VLIVDALLVSGIKFVLSRLAEAVEAEMYDESALREELLAAQMKLELGEIDEEEFTRIETQVLAGIREVKARRDAVGQAARAHGGAAGGDGEKFTVASVDAHLEHHEHDERDDRIDHVR
jgi:hypothetical protein